MVVRILDIFGSCSRGQSTFSKLYPKSLPPFHILKCAACFTRQSHALGYTLLVNSSNPPSAGTIPCSPNKVKGFRQIWNSRGKNVPVNYTKLYKMRILY